MLKGLSLFALLLNLIWLGWIGYAFIINGFRPQMWQDYIVSTAPLLNTITLSAWLLTTGPGLVGLWVEKKKADLRQDISSSR